MAPVLSAGRTLVIVGPQRSLDSAHAGGIQWTREIPPGGGPLAVTAAGLRLVRAPLVAVLAVDLPFISWAAVHRLATALVAQPSAPGALYVDATGHDQLLFGVRRTTRLRAALPSDPHGKPMRLLAGQTGQRVVERLEPQRLLGVDQREDQPAVVQHREQLAGQQSRHHQCRGQQRNSVPVTGELVADRDRHRQPGGKVGQQRSRSRLHRPRLVDLLGPGCARRACCGRGSAGTHRTSRRPPGCRWRSYPRRIR